MEGDPQRNRATRKQLQSPNPPKPTGDPRFRPRSRLLQSPGSTRGAAADDQGHATPYQVRKAQELLSQAMPPNLSPEPTVSYKRGQKPCGENP